MKGKGHIGKGKVSKYSYTPKSSKKGGSGNTGTKTVPKATPKGKVS